MRRICIAVAVLCMAPLPLLAQGRGGQGSTASSSRTTSSTGSGSTGTAASAPSTSSARTSSAITMSSTARSGGASNYMSMPSGGSSRTTPNIKGTSFVSYGSFYQWENFLFSLRSMYGLNLDTSRFYRNVEPLVTPRMAVAASMQPLRLSTQLVSTIDELSMLLDEARTGKAVDHNAIEATLDQIRRLAKKIRSDPALSYIDQRPDKDIFKGVKVNDFGLDAIEQMQKLALDLNNQLKTLSSQSQTATVSVDYMTQPSYTSISKGIEKLSKVIQSSAKQF